MKARPHRTGFRRISRPSLILLFSLVVAAACDLPSATERRIDAVWFRHSLVEGHLSHWLQAAPTPQGRFRFNADRNWRAKEENVADLTAQARFVYVMAAGYELTGDSRYLDQVKAGADFMLTRMHDPEFGGFFDRVSPEGKVLYPGKQSYGNAFAIFGLAHAYRATGDVRYLDAAMDNWRVVKRHLWDPGGGLAPATSQDFSRREGVNTQNPMMHLFEALLALYDASGSTLILGGRSPGGGFRGAPVVCRRRLWWLYTGILRRRLEAAANGQRWIR